MKVQSPKSKVQSFALMVVLMISLWARGQTGITIPGSQFPVVTTPSNSWRILIVCPLGDAQGIDLLHDSNATILWTDLAASMGAVLSTNTVFLQELVTNQNFITNLQTVLVTNNTVNSNTAAIAQSNALLYAPYSLNTGYVLTSVGGVTNYFLDCSRTNNLLQTNVYATIDAQNNVNILAVTNMPHGSWAPFSFNIIADGGNRVVWFPGSWWNPPMADLSTNNLTADGSTYRITLASGNEMRVTIQTNAANHFSIIWTTFGQ